MPTHTKTECDKGDKIDRIEKALFFGNGKPAITSQLELMNARFDIVEKKIEGALSIGKAIVLGFATLVIADVYQMYKSHVSKEAHYAEARK
jgi:hypothetical protein